MAIIIVEPDKTYAAWLASTMAGLDSRVVRTTTPDEAMAALAADGADVLGAVFGPSLSDPEVLALADQFQQGAPDVSVLLIREQESGDLLRAALRRGVKDVLPATVDEDALYASASRALEMARTLRGRINATTGAPEPDQAGEPGKVITVFSSKGGNGKTFLATNLAFALAQTGGEVVLVDLDLQFGDVAIMLQLFPAHTIHTAAQTPDLDSMALKSFLTHHRSGIWTLVAPTEPTAAEAISPATINKMLRLLSEDFDYVVVDTPPAFSEQVLAAFDESDAIAMVASLDVPSIKNLKIALQTLELLRFPRNKIRVVLNRADSKVGLRLADVEKILGTPIDVTIPSSRSVPLSVNRGNPIILEEPKNAVSEAIRGAASQFAKPRASRSGRNGGKRRSLFSRS
jgi:pilus assembly protein CpaE